MGVTYLFAKITNGKDFDIIIGRDPFLKIPRCQLPPCPQGSLLLPRGLSLSATLPDPSAKVQIPWSHPRDLDSVALQQGPGICMFAVCLIPVQKNIIPVLVTRFINIVPGGEWL